MGSIISLAATRRALPGRLFAPVDSASLAFFRIAFGGIMLWEVWRYFDHGWIERYWVEPTFHFAYYGLDWIRPWPGVGMDLHWLALGVLAICITLGAWYRISATLFFIGFTYVFLLDQARYLNHFYLVSLISFLLIFVPAHEYFSLDALLKPELRSRLVPAWPIWLLRFQVGVPYFFGGIAKLNADWLRGEPLRAWLADRADFPVIGQFFTIEPVVWLMTYGALFLDLFAVFLLTNRRTRVFGYLAITTFHFFNSRLFSIGIFPWMMIVATAIFFEPDWPRRVLQDLRQGHPFRIPALAGGFALGFFTGGFLPSSFSLAQALIGAIGVAIAAYHLDEPFRRPEAEIARARAKPPESKKQKEAAKWKRKVPIRLSRVQRWTIALLSMWVAVQVLVPLRHFAIPGNVEWTEEGLKFSWHMLLRDKTSYGYFMITDPGTGDEWYVDPGDYLTSWQQRKMSSNPDMIAEFAYYLEDQIRAEGHEDVEIRARFFASLNGREPQMLIDPEVDLTEVLYPWLGHADWILPLHVPLRAIE